jgi:menaquinone-dependent protoporphyrinogen oxidase
MHVLVTWGTKLGGTEGIAQIIGDVLKQGGFEVTLAPASQLRDVRGYDAAIVGGGLYANRWHRDARRFVAGKIAALRRIPVWLFSSGPLDDSADHQDIPATKDVAVLAERIGAVGHVTFGGRIAPDAKGFPAAGMARTNAGDWRNPDRIRTWAAAVARALPGARPGAAVDPPARSLPRLAVHGFAGWAVCAALMGGLLRVASPGVAGAVHAMVAPLVFVAIAAHYFGARGAHEPLPTALAFAAMFATLDAGVVAALASRSFAMLSSFAGTWLPLALVVLSTWVTGFVISTMPWSKPPKTQAGARNPAGGRDDARHVPVAGK